MSTDTQPTLPFGEVPGASGSSDVADAAGGSGRSDGSTSPVPRAARGPVIRWGAIVWGLALAAVAAVVLTIVTDVGRRQAVVTWVDGLTPGTFTLYALLALGALLLVAGLAGVLRRTTRRND
jgi:hypothetical protein